MADMILLPPPSPLTLMGWSGGVTDDDVIQTWMRRSAGTIATQCAYRADVAVFRAVLPQPLRTITAMDFQTFADSLTKMALATQRRRIASMKSLLKFANETRYLAVNVGIAVRTPIARDDRAQRIMSEADVLSMLQAAAGRGARDLAIIHVLYAAGLRISELANLRWSDLTSREHGGQLSIFGKGRRTRNILISMKSYALVMALQKSDSRPDWSVFGGANGPLHVMTIHRVVKTAARLAGLSKAVSAHWLRHAHASHALDRNAPIHLIMETLGHASLETTSRYLHARPKDSSSRYLVL